MRVTPNNRFNTSNAVHILVHIVGIPFYELSVHSSVSQRTLRAIEGNEQIHSGAAMISPNVKQRLVPVVENIMSDLYTTQMGRAIYTRLKALVGAKEAFDIVPITLGSSRPPSDHPVMYLHRDLGISMKEIARLSDVSQPTIRRILSGDVRAFHNNRILIKRALRATLKSIRRYYVDHNEQAETLEYMLKNFDKLSADTHRSNVMKVPTTEDWRERIPLKLDTPGGLGSAKRKEKRREHADSGHPLTYINDTIGLSRKNISLFSGIPAVSVGRLINSPNEDELFKYRDHIFRLLTLLQKRMKQEYPGRGGQIETLRRMAHNLDEILESLS